MLVQILLTIVLLWYMVCNVLVVFMYTPKAMYREMWVEQTIFGKISANIFYAPAWLLNGIFLSILISFYWIIKGIALGTLWVTQKLNTNYTKAIKGEL